MSQIYSFSGYTMGTTYNITCRLPLGSDPSKIDRAINRCLKRVMASMSKYDEQSELSQFNAKRDMDPMPISPSFFYVLTQADYVYRLSDGAWDGTLMPVVDAWGFGKNDKPDHVPSARQISERKSSIGFSKIHFYKTGRQAFIQKRDPSVSLDLGSIAKGYGVDAVTAMLKKKKLEHFIVEVGGEIYVSGEKAKGEPWVIGINYPEIDAPPDKAYAAIALQQQAIATSGNYRVFVSLDGKLFSHTIDPRTLKPVMNSIVSVSVMAPNCTLADGLTTAIIIMGPEKGLAMIERLKNIYALVIIREKDQLMHYLTSKFKPIHFF